MVGVDPSGHQSGLLRDGLDWMHLPSGDLAWPKLLYALQLFSLDQIVHPSANPVQVDALAVFGLIGLLNFTQRQVGQTLSVAMNNDVQYFGHLARDHAGTHRIIRQPGAVHGINLGI
jgi:hypothetical protein